MKHYSYFTTGYSILTVLLILIVPFSGFTQFVIPYKEKVEEPKHDYKAWVRTTDGSAKLKGRFLEIEDSKLLFYKKSAKSAIHLNISDIEHIKFRKNGRIGRGVFTGAMMGISTGAILGYLSGDDKCEGLICINFTKEEKAVLGGLIMSVPGAIIGGLLGALKVKIPIGSGYDKDLAKLKKYQLY